MVSLYAISDLHLSFGKNKPMDVFEGWEDYANRLEKNWKNIVTKYDSVVIAGDISWAMNLSGSRDDFLFLESLPGEKIIMRGNHDYWWGSVKKINDFFSVSGFKSVKLLHNNAIETQDFCVCGARGWLCRPQSDHDVKICKREIQRLELSLSSAEGSKSEKIAFMHYPPIYGGEEFEDVFDVLKKYEIKRCYYGHVHGKDAFKRSFIGEYKGVNLELISCDYTGFTPKLVPKGRF
ncbi:MAG: metallophosphoesterase [Oscillospiraceae bacterium]|jgi:predicted phosphohydrolase|nr:metallophosphoesterase [Oscillospiraceae bacterium]